MKQSFIVANIRSLCSLWAVVKYSLITGLALLAGCAGKVVDVPVAVVVKPTACAEMTAPTLPKLSAAYSLEDKRNLRALLERDDAMRAYIAGLRATAACYKAQAAQDADTAQETTEDTAAEENDAGHD